MSLPKKLRCSYHYSTDNDYTIHPFRKPSGHTPIKVKTAFHIQISFFCSNVYSITTTSKDLPSPELSDIRKYQITQLIALKFKHAKKIFFMAVLEMTVSVFDGTENEMMAFFNIGSSCHKHLKFTFEIARNSCVFRFLILTVGLIEGKARLHHWCISDNFKFDTG